MKASSLKRVMAVCLALIMAFLPVFSFLSLPIAAEGAAPNLIVGVQLGERFSANAKVVVPAGVSASEAGVYVDGEKLAGTAASGYYAVPNVFKTAAKETGRRVSVQAYYVADGTEVKGKAVQTSIAELLRAELDSKNASTVALATAALNYAAAAQTYFTYDTENLVNEGISPILPEKIYTDNFAVVTPKADATVAPREMTLLLNDRVDLRVAAGVRAGATVDFTSLCLAISESADMSGALTVPFDEEGIAVVDGISPSNWEKTYYFRIEDRAGNAASATFSYGVSTYFARMGKNEDQTLCDLLSSMMALGECREAYIASGAEVPSTPLTLAPDSVYALVGEEIALTADGMAERDVRLAYSSDAVADVTVSGASFLVTALKEGAHTFTVTDGVRVASCTVTVYPNEEVAHTVNDPDIRILGRTEKNAAGAILFNNTASGLEVTFYGTALTVTMCNDAAKSDTAKFAVFIDGAGDPAVDQIDLSTAGVAEGDSRKIALCSFAEPGLHTVRIQKITQESLATAIFSGLSVTGKLLPTEEKDALRLMIYGDSIICGHSNMREDGTDDTQCSANENGLLTYGMRAATMLGAEAHVFSRSGLGLYTNPYNSSLYLKNIYGKVSPLSKTNWDMQSWIPDAVIINIGTNDIWAPNGSTGNVPYTAEDYAAAYVQMVREMTSIWGRGTTFFLCTSMMESGLTPAVKAAADELANTYGIKAQMVELPHQLNVGGHPTNASHVAAAQVLYNAILNANVDRPYIPGENETDRDEITDIFKP